MRHWILVATLVLCVRQVAPVSAQTLDPVTDWVRQGAELDAVKGGFALRKGALRSPSFITNFVIQFDYRVLDAETDAWLWLRRAARRGTKQGGYQVSLASRNSRTPIGVVVANGVKARLSAASPRTHATPPGDWRRVLVSARDAAVVVAVDGQEVRAEDLDGVTGHVELQVARGKGIEVRGLGIVRVAWAADPFPSEGAVEIEPTRKEAPDLVLPRVVSRPTPFSPNALRSGFRGAVVIKARLDETGTVRDMAIVESLGPDYDESSLAHARRWRFEPAKQAGAAVPSIITIMMWFIGL